MAITDCHSAAQLRDRIKSVRIANVYEPHHYRHIISGVQNVSGEGGNGFTWDASKIPCIIHCPAVQRQLTLYLRIA